MVCLGLCVCLHKGIATVHASLYLLWHAKFKDSTCNSVLIYTFQVCSYSYRLFTFSGCATQLAASHDHCCPWSVNRNRVVRPTSHTYLTLFNGLKLIGDRMDENCRKAGTEKHSDNVVAGLPVQQYDQDQLLPPVYTYPTHPSDAPPATSDDVVTGLAVGLQQYDQEQPLPPLYTYPTHPSDVIPATRDDMATGLPVKQYEQDQPLPSVLTYPTHPSDVIPATSDDIATGLPVQQYDQEQPLPSVYTYPTHPGRGVHPKDGESARVNIYQPQTVSQLLAMTTSPTSVSATAGTSELYVSHVAMAGTLTNPPGHYLGLSIFSFLCCCWIFGIFAISASGRYSSKARFTLSYFSLIRHYDESDQTILSD